VHTVPFTAAEGSMAKLVASETADYVTDEAIQILGGNGHTRGRRAHAPGREDLHPLRGHQ